MEFRGGGDGILFWHMDQSPLLKHQFWAVTTQSLAELGVCFCTQSFRIGAASIEATMGYSTQAIQHVGGWSSTAYKSYIRPLSFNVFVTQVIVISFRS